VSLHAMFPLVGAKLVPWYKNEPFLFVRRFRFVVTSIKSPPNTSNFFLFTRKIFSYGCIKSKFISKNLVVVVVVVVSFVVMMLRNYLFAVIVDCLQAQVFNPKNTNISEDKLSSWLQDKVTGDIEEIPGIGPANKKLLADGECSILSSICILAYLYFLLLINMVLFLFLLSFSPPVLKLVLETLTN
jgi:hypothetical protein